MFFQPGIRSGWISLAHEPYQIYGKVDVVPDRRVGHAQSGCNTRDMSLRVGQFCRPLHPIEHGRMRSPHADSVIASVLARPDTDVRRRRQNRFQMRFRQVRRVGAKNESHPVSPGQSSLRCRQHSLTQVPFALLDLWVYKLLPCIGGLVRMNFNIGYF